MVLLIPRGKTSSKQLEHSILEAKSVISYYSSAYTWSDQKCSEQGSMMTIFWNSRTMASQSQFTVTRLLRFREVSRLRR